MFKGKLHPYQEEATERFINRRSLLLAYGCGTGKTVMAIAATERLLGKNEINYCLILCPASLKYQWKAKIDEFTNSTSLVIDGNKDKRSAQYSFFNTSFVDVKYIIAGYDCVINDYEYVSKLKPGMVIADEVSAIKSFKAIRSKE